MDFLEALKLEIGDVSDLYSDTVLSQYLEKAKATALRNLYPYYNEPKGYDISVEEPWYVVTTAIYLLDHRGVDTDKSRSENGIQIAYGSMADVMAKHGLYPHGKLL